MPAPKKPRAAIRPSAAQPGAPAARRGKPAAADQAAAPAARPDALEALVAQMLAGLGEDPRREGLIRTPQRVAKAMRFMTQGYGQDPLVLLNDAVFEEETDEMVVVRDIEVYSLCEHHMVPFFGRAHVGYLPRGRIVGLSKIPRIVDAFARRLQVQERLTSQIARALDSVLHPRGVGVVIEAQHLCMMMRGVQKQNSRAVTSCMLGLFRSDARTRSEFLEFTR